MDFDFLPYFKPLAYLLLIVLYLESWKTLGRLFKKNRFKFQFLHFIVLLLLTLGLSRVDVINYNSIDKALLKNNPIINLPYSNFYRDNVNWKHAFVQFKIQLEENKDLVIFTYDRRKIKLENISQEILMERNLMREELIYFLTVRISANKDIDLKYVKMVEAELYSINQRSIIYEVYNNDLLTKRFETQGIKYRISPFVLEFKKDKSIPIPPLPFPIDSIKPKNTLKIKVGKTIEINGEIIPENALVGEFEKQVGKTNIFEYLYDDNTKYQDYITVLSSHYEAVYKLRKQDQTIFREYEHQYDKQYKDEQDKLKQKYPIRIIETLK